MRVGSGWTSVACLSDVVWVDIRMGDSPWLTQMSSISSCLEFNFHPRNVYNYIITGFCQLHELSAVTEYDSSHITFLLLHMTLYDILL